MPVIKKEYPCGCCIGIAVVRNRMRSTGILNQCKTCTDAIMQARLDIIFAEIKEDPKASKYLLALDSAL